MFWTRNVLTVILWIECIFSLVKNVATLDPKFDPSTTMRLVLVPADATVGSVIFRLRASDEEFDYPLIFELIGDVSSSIVQIDSLPCTKYNSVCQANVVLRRRLEPGRYYDFQVSVKDSKGGMAQQSCSITATNFTTPIDTIFPKKTNIIMVPEDAKRGSELDYVVARKNPLYPKPVYLELWGSPLFAMRQKIVTSEMSEGTIFLLGPLDFEKQSMYHLTLLANDAYAEPGQDSRNIGGLEIVVIVEDVQDVPPVFTVAPPVTRLPSGLIPGDKILQVHAEDGDKGIPREIRYGLVSEGNPFTSFFDINDTTGEITLVRPLDEISAITHIGDPVLLTVIAEEVKVMRNEPPAMATTVQLALFLPERSNSPPYFENDHYVTRIEENSPTGTTLVFPDPYVTRVSDDDAGKNGVFSLTLLGNNGTFEILPNVAERKANFIIKVRDNALLDYEQHTSLSFQILAQELGPATNLSAIVNITVYLMDVNDNAPLFVQQEYTVQLPENMTVGTRVVQVHADDIDTGLGGRIRYTQILGYLNTSLNLDASSGSITVSTDNHGFDREKMPEYHLYVEARDENGVGNRAEVPLIIKLIDVNDETPTFEKSLYEFILTTDLRNFTVPAYIKAIDKDAEAPNNLVRYEIIHGNYESKFSLNDVTGQLMLREPLNFRKQTKRQINTPIDMDIFVLTVRAYDLGIPSRYSTAIVRIYPPESRTRVLSFLVPGYNPDRSKVEDTLSEMTGGRVVIQDIRPYTGNLGGSSGGKREEKSVVTATVVYNTDSVIDIAKLRERLINSDNSNGIRIHEESANVYKAENRVLFWMLIFLGLLLAIGILTLLLCCICSWCPLYAATRKRVSRVNSTDDDVNLVHRECGIGKPSKSVQVAEWMGRGREAWKEGTSDPRTKPTRWEFSKRGCQKLGLDNPGADDDDNDNTMNKSFNLKVNGEKETVDIVNENQATKEKRKSNLKIDHNYKYEEDGGDDDQDYTSIKHVNIKDQNRSRVDEDSMRRHELDRGSDIDYERRISFKRQEAQEEANISGRDQLYIKDGNAEILRLVTRGRAEDGDNNIYVNVPRAPNYIMIDNGGKEILMRRFIEDQANGKQIIREHYQVIPNTTYIQALPNEVREPNAQQRDAIQQQSQSQANLQPSENQNMQPAVSSQSIIQQELENSLKQQNELLRAILLEKQELEEKYKQEEQALETQSLPCHSLTQAAQTQTDCEIAVQTDPLSDPNFSKTTLNRRRTRSENDDSVSEEDYEYVRYSPPNSPNGVYLIKRRRTHRKNKGKHKESDHRPAATHKKSVTVESVKRKIRTPIEEETEDGRTPHVIHKETRTSNLRRQRAEASKSKNYHLDDGFGDELTTKTKSSKQIKYYVEDSDGSENEVIMHKNYYSADSLDDFEETTEERRRRLTESVPPTPASRAADRSRERSDRPRKGRYVESEEVRIHKTTAPRPPEKPDKPRMKTRYASDLDLPETKAVPRYMEWYAKNKETTRSQNSLDRSDRKGVTRKISKSSKSSEDSTKSKPEPYPRSKDTPTKEGSRFLKEDIERARKIETKTNRADISSHPLLQHSEHRYEYEYHAQSQEPPAKLPHYLYPNTPPNQSGQETIQDQKVNKFKPQASPIKENEVSKTTTTIKIPIGKNNGSAGGAGASDKVNITTTTVTTTTQNNNEDDHDSGIAMNSLLMGKRNKKSDKKSIFTIAYDDVQIKQIQSDTDHHTPPFS